MADIIEGEYSLVPQPSRAPTSYAPPHASFYDSYGRLEKGPSAPQLLAGDLREIGSRVGKFAKETAPLWIPLVAMHVGATISNAQEPVFNFIGRNLPPPFRQFPKDVADFVLPLDRMQMRGLMMDLMKAKLSHPAPEGNNITDTLTLWCGGVAGLATLVTAGIYLIKRQVNPLNTQDELSAGERATKEAVEASRAFFAGLNDNQRDNFEFNSWLSYSLKASRLDGALAKIFISRYGQNSETMNMRDFVNQATNALAELDAKNIIGQLKKHEYEIQNLTADVALVQQNMDSVTAVIAGVINQMEKQSQNIEQINARSQSVTQSEINDAYMNDSRLR